MLALERRNLILEKLQAEKRVVVSELSQLYDVSEETIRRDLDKLEKEGLAIKSYGGAVINEDVSIDLPFNVRKNQNVTGKQKMAELAASLVKDGDHIFLDASTTAVFVAKALKEKERLTVITNSMEILLELADVSGWNIISTGGVMKEGYLAFLGSKTDESIRSYYVPGTKEPVYTVEQALEAVKEIGFPVMIKASAGGGGKGMRVAGNEQEFAKLFETAQQESVHSFSDNTMYLERFVENPRHVEVQILADKYGNVVHLGERDCSVQRRHQKMIEESPCIAISDDLRKKMGETAVRAAKAAGYESAGTIEFLLDQSGEFYFMEMNTRIQVEHPVTEFVSGVDLIKEQVCIAAGEPLSVQQKDIEIRGHAMECRINAEDPERHFMPCPGKITDLHLPGGNGIRVDTAVYNDYAIPPYYDSMIAKIIVYDRDRRSAIRKMISALGEVAIEGVKTNVDFLYELLNQPDFQEGNITTDFIPQHYPDL